MDGKLIDRFRNRFRLRCKCIRWRDEVFDSSLSLVVVVGGGRAIGVGGLRLALRALCSAEPCFSIGLATLNSFLDGAQERREKRRLQRQQPAAGTRARGISDRANERCTGADETSRGCIASAHRTCVLARSKHEREGGLWRCVLVV